MTDTLQAILLVPIVGNHAGDQVLIERIYDFVHSSAPVADRAAAIRHLSEQVMGDDGSTASFDDVSLVSSFIGE